MLTELDLLYTWGKMDTLSLIQNEIKILPDFKAQEVLDFIIFLKTRNLEPNIICIISACKASKWEKTYYEQNN